MKKKFEKLSSEATAKLGTTIEHALKEVTSSPKEPPLYALLWVDGEGVHINSNLPEEGIRHLVSSVHSRMLHSTPDASFYAIFGGGGKG